MRTEHVNRLSSINLPKNSKDYIVMHFLLKDLKYAISRYAFGKVLDVGCGNKPYEKLFENISNYKGCDVVQSNENKVDVLCLATDIKVDSNSVDTVFSTQVMEHVNNTDLMLQECNRVLNANGNLILSVPFCWELHEEPYDFYRFTKYSLQELCNRNNFDVLEIIPNGGKWAAIFQMNINIVHSTFKRKTIGTKILKLLFLNLRLTALINIFAIWLDKKYTDYLLTLNYVLIAKKRI